MLRNLSQRARAAVVVAATALAAVPVVGTLASNNPADECGEGIPYAKFEVDGSKWEGDRAAYGSTVTLSADGITAAWSSVTPATSVHVKSSTSTIAWAGGTSGVGVYGHLDREISHITFCYPGGDGGGTTTTTEAPTTTTTVLPPLQPLTLDVEAAGSYTKTFLWDIAKAATVEWIARSGGSAPLTYSVTTTSTGYDLSEQDLTGTVTVTNPNAENVTVTSVAVTDADCQVQQPAIVAPGDTELDVVCDVIGLEDEGQRPGSLDASIGWADPSPLATVFGATGSGAVAWDVTKVNETVSVVDAFDGGAAEPIATGTYSRTASTPATQGCRVVGNVATIVETGQSASDSVTVCRQALTKGGFTIGFWQNKNGQNMIGANATALCSKLAAYGTAWAGSGFPTTCNATTLKAWVTTVIKSASSTNHTLMLRAQMLATALNVHTDTVNHLGETDVPVNGGCQTVSALLSSTNATWSALAANRANGLAIKDVFDRINNNVQQVCA